ncbi:hypothetical protein FRC12_002973 [Ceratobasidium sp. 428]|nr:hypothetical protein FRC12_002973 [Ceratobasidium sp. 428]
MSSDILNSDVAYKGKKASKGSDQDEDAFVIEEEQELFATPADTRPTTDVKTSESQSHKLAQNRAKYFQKAKEDLLANPEYAAYHGWREHNSGKASDSPIADNTVRQKHAKAKDPPRRAILARMISHASTRPELLDIVNVFSIFREKKWPIDELNRIDFIGRCISLKSPDIALSVLYHRPQFGIDIPSLSTGRALLHSLLYAPDPPSDTPLPDHLALPTSTPFTHALLLSNLFDVYALPPVESDEVTRALLLGACANYEKKDIHSEDVGVITQKIRDWAEAQKPTGEAGAEGTTLPIQEQGKLVRSVKAIKDRGKASPNKGATPVALAESAPPESILPYSNQLTAPERAWTQQGLDHFVQWAQEKGEGIEWVEKLRARVA